jgi:hypothetical protein
MHPVVGGLEMAETDLITLPRATVQQALEALECIEYGICGIDYGPSDDTTESAITALRAALEQPEQENPTRQMPEWMDYDQATDVLTIHGRRYSAAMFGERGFLSPAGTLLQVAEGQPDCVTLMTVAALEQPEQCMAHGECFGGQCIYTSRSGQPEQDTDCHAQGICQRSGYGIGRPEQEPDRWGEGYEAGYAAGMAEMKQEQAEPDAYGYASRLAVAIWEKHYKATAANWKPLPDLMGVLTQIDNMTAGLTRQQAQPEQAEPVAIVEIVVPHLESIGIKHILGAHFPQVGDYLYTAPPRREWVGLTDEEIMELLDYGQYGRVPEYARNFVDAIEAKLKEKNHD